MVILWNTQYYNKIETGKYTKNKYYDVCYNFLMYNPDLRKDIGSQEKYMWKCALLKKAKNHSKKTLSWFSLELKKKIARNTIQWLNCVVHYLNVKIKGKWIDII